ncbi:MAG: Asp-tRNA(Asn)/Glu-tRNA(Gln) amidotransferase subunit GatC [Candidatus Edwardsbacteria bacterium]
MPVTIEEVKHIAELARLQFTEKELIRFTEEFNKILEYVEKLKEVSTEGVKPLLHSPITPVVVSECETPWLLSQEVEPSVVDLRARQKGREGQANTADRLEGKNVLREDEVKDSLSQESALFNAPQKERGYFRVPKVLKSFLFSLMA